MAGKSVSHHHRHSAWQRTELQPVYGDTGLTEIDCATGADRNTGVMKMDRATGSIYLGDPKVDTSELAPQIVSYLIPSHCMVPRIIHSIVPIL